MTRINEADWAIAETRLAAVRRLHAAAKMTHEVIDGEAASLGVSRYRLYEWLRRYRANPTIESLLPQKRGFKSGAGRLPDSVETVILETIEDFYLTDQQPKLRTLVTEIARRCRAADLNVTPDYRTVKARVERVLPSIRTRARRGNKAADDQFRPVIGELYADFAMEVIQFDHTLADVIVVDESFRQPIARPWLTLGIDVSSSAIVGYYLTLEAPSALSVAMALTHTVLPKAKYLEGQGVTAPWPIHGIPATIHLDNAKEFHSRALERGCREYGIHLRYRPVRTPHYGGHIERLVGTMMGEMHLLPGTTFSGIEEKGDYDPEKKAVLTLRELEQWLAIQVIAHNGKIHRTRKIPPQLAYEDALARRSAPISLPKDEQRFLLDFLPFEMRMVRRDGIQMFNIHYWDNVLTVWAGQTKQRMVVKYDPRDLSRMLLLDPEGHYWPIPYRDLRRPRITLWEHNRATEALHQRGRAAVDEGMLFDAIAAQRMLVAEAAAKTKKARRDMQRTANAMAATKAPAAVLPAEPASDPPPAPSAVPILPFEVEEWS
ncbi:Mu transposase C-terminal domain-containing protein [Paramagnetospirillum kuznetsovii]|uniref:Mu transposase C-terminal domain-containing protein n=1 Tax=Paramagnetospirillum kuznetsovii TaxID=2053833 RepID=UPI001961C683|nr:Mu transposase C-terminal domain-containing protein [Paramagnetospirillum kuznetsovii]